MILTGKKLQEFGQALYGPIWVSVLSRKLHRTKRTIMRWRDKAPPGDTRQQLLDLIDEQFAVLGEKRSELAAHWDDA